MIKLFVAGIPDNLQEIGLIELFSLHALVSSIRLVTDKHTGKCLGYGFIEVPDLAAANKAIDALNGLKVGTRKLEVKIAEERNKPVVKRPQERQVKRTVPVPPTPVQAKPVAEEVVVKEKSKRPRLKSS